MRPTQPRAPRKVSRPEIRVPPTASRVIRTQSSGLSPWALLCLLFVVGGAMATPFLLNRPPTVPAPEHIQARQEFVVGQQGGEPAKLHTIFPDPERDDSPKPHSMNPGGSANGTHSSNFGTAFGRRATNEEAQAIKDARQQVAEENQRLLGK